MLVQMVMEVGMMVVVLLQQRYAAGRDGRRRGGRVGVDGHFGGTAAPAAARTAYAGCRAEVADTTNSGGHYRC